MLLSSLPKPHPYAWHGTTAHTRAQVKTLLPEEVKATSPTVCLATERRI